MSKGLWGRPFDRDMFIMLFAFMIAAVIITYFVADLVNRSKIETITEQYETEISYIASQSKRFVDNYTAAVAHVDLAREANNDGQYFFDLASYIYERGMYEDVVENCSGAMYYFTAAYNEFNISKPLFSNSREYSPEPYIPLIDYYKKYVDSGMNLTLDGYNQSVHLKAAAENYSQGHQTTAASHIDLVNQSKLSFNQEMIIFDEYLTKIKDFIEIR